MLKVVNLIVVFSRKYRWSEHYFSVWSLGNYQKLLKPNQLLVSTIFFHNYSVTYIKRTPLVQKNVSVFQRCLLYRDFFFKIVWPQSKAIHSSSYCPSYRGVRFIVCPLYIDSTIWIFLFSVYVFISFQSPSKKSIKSRAM